MIQSRRAFVKTTLAASALPMIHCGSSAIETKKIPFELGIASYTFREFNTTDTLTMTARLGIQNIAFKSFHLPLDSSNEAIAQTVNQVKAAGITLYGGGVIYMKTAEAVEKAFSYAQAAGMNVIIGVPAHDLLDFVEEKVKQTDIKLAIHNHGPGDKLYPSPQSAYEKIQNRDARMGLCVDIGHAQRIGIDPAQTIRDLADRVYDVHIKDVSAASKEGHTVEIGRGVIDIPEFLTALMDVQYAGVAGFEYEKDGKDPLPGLAESVGYVRGVLDTI